MTHTLREAIDIIKAIPDDQLTRGFGDIFRPNAPACPATHLFRTWDLSDEYGICDAVDDALGKLRTNWDHGFSWVEIVEVYDRSWREHLSAEEREELMNADERHGFNWRPKFPAFAQARDDVVAHLEKLV